MAQAAKTTTPTEPQKLPADPFEALRVPFAPNQIGKLPKPYKKDSAKGRCDVCGGWHGLPAAHLDYVGHAALTDRLLDVDPSWTWEPLAFTPAGLPAFDQSGGLWIKLTVAGVTRLGYGHAAQKSDRDPGSREKEIIGDALRNAGMRFGMALDLWHKGDLHSDDEETAPAQQRAPAQQQTAREPMQTKTERAPRPAGRAPGEKTGSVTASEAQIMLLETEGELRAWPEKNTAFLQKLDEDEYQQVSAFWKARLEEVRNPGPLSETAISKLMSEDDLARWAADNKPALDELDDVTYKRLLNAWNARATQVRRSDFGASA